MGWPLTGTRLQSRFTVEVPNEATVYDATHHSGILKMFPHIDLETQKVGIFGKIVKPETALHAGDRVGIYRPITCALQTIRRRVGVGAEDD